jgi:membrane fusion protein (multidrug efflux system)
MSRKLGTFAGLLVLLAGSGGVYLLSRHRPAVEQAPEAQTPTVVPVEVGQIRRMTLHEYLDAYGSVLANPGIGDVAPAGAQIDSPLDGIVTQVHCLLGQQVKKGQVLFALYDEPAKVAMEQAEKTVAFAQANFERQESLQKVQGTSAKLLLEARQQLDSARNDLAQAEVQLQLHKVMAPFDGTITDVCVRAGEAVARTGPLARLTDLRRLVVKAEVPRPQVDKLQLGQRVQIDPGARTATSDSSAQRSFRLVDYIDCQVDPNSDTVAVLVGLPADTDLRPGQFVRVRIVVGEYRDQLAVPEESIVTTLEGETIIALVQGDEAIPTPVKRGVSEDHWVQVEGQGLEPGSNVVTVGAYGLPGRTRIRVIGH